MTLAQLLGALAMAVLGLTGWVWHLDDTQDRDITNRIDKADAKIIDRMDLKHNHLVELMNQSMLQSEMRHDMLMRDIKDMKTNIDDMAKK